MCFPFFSLTHTSSRNKKIKKKWTNKLKVAFRQFGPCIREVFFFLSFLLHSLTRMPHAWMHQRFRRFAGKECVRRSPIVSLNSVSQKDSPKRGTSTAKERQRARVWVKKTGTLIPPNALAVSFLCTLCNALTESARPKYISLHLARCRVATPLERKSRKSPSRCWERERESARTGEQQRGSANQLK